MKVAAETSNGEGRKRPAAKKKHGCGGRRTRRRVQAASSAIQRLFLACKTVFKGPGTVPEPADVEKLQLLLDKMGPEDVGLSTDLLFFREKETPKKTSRITYATIYKCDNFSICIFFLPQAAVIPLHDHPGMTVFSKLLLGSMHIKSYDWLDPTTSSNSGAAKLIVDSDFTAPCDASVLYPTTGGNIHAFTAITPCAVLDVLGPPYSKEDGRDITYYRDYPDHSKVSCKTQISSTLSMILRALTRQLYEQFAASAADRNGEKDDRVGWLEEADISKDLKMDGVEYLGPKVVDRR